MCLMQSELGGGEGGAGPVRRKTCERLCRHLVIREAQRRSDAFLLVFTPPSQLRMTMATIDWLIGPCLPAVQISVERRLVFAECWFVKSHLFASDCVHLKYLKTSQ